MLFRNIMLTRILHPYQLTLRLSTTMNMLQRGMVYIRPTAATAVFCACTRALRKDSVDRRIMIRLMIITLILLRLHLRSEVTVVNNRIIHLQRDVQPIKIAGDRVQRLIRHHKSSVTLIRHRSLLHINVN